MTEETLSFEDALQQLEDIHRELEAGNLPLEESVTLYEKGQELVKICQAHLEQAELRIQQIDDNGIVS